MKMRFRLWLARWLCPLRVPGIVEVELLEAPEIIGVEV